ncbi:phage major capsid protein [Mesobacillus subterraneus]|uniref:phage major capsid protein n=1 Tax=Mesobacillus subterraneus TaxID=285983 RepID=UPI00203C4C20|nr:phage major capsid protein [Mesobacillus subterraneus]MCM3663455.1 phage major capsid protein [Mesobacillus subterraneus]MCM3683225.1 phage major capsid protein [Mesobacillus subterraneus]
MNKELREMLEKISNKKAEAKRLLAENKIEEAKAARDEAQELQNKFDIAKDLYDDEKTNAQNLAPVPFVTNDAPTYKDVFMKAIRGYNLSGEERDLLAANYVRPENKLSSASGPDGGYVIPEDITTDINELKKTVDNLEQYVTVEPVTTDKGARTLEKRADSTPFTLLSEYGNPNTMSEMDSPQFDRLSYEIEDYAGFLPVPNNLLNDSDQALEAYLKKWIAKKSKATRNSLILAALNTLVKTTISGNLVDGIKKILNVTLDPAFSVGGKIYTNQDGFNKLDTLKTSDGKYLLEDDITSPSGKAISGRQVVVLSNKTIATVEDGAAGTAMAPFIVGDLKEAVVLWDREQLLIDMTKEGGNAWRSNTTEFRAIEREDVTLWDDEAVVYAQFDITPVA